MKLLKHTWQRIVDTHSFLLSAVAVVIVFMFVSAAFVVANGKTMGPTDSHMVNLYVDNKESIIPTRAATVKDFLEKANIKLYPADLVEPAVDTAITSDNFKVQIYRARPVTIIDGGQVIRILSPHNSALLIAQQAGLAVYPQDILTITTPTNFVTDTILGNKLLIQRATPVSLSLYSAPAANYRTQAKTVGDFLKEQEVVAETGATVTPDVVTPITPNMAIYISKFGKQVVTVEEPVNFGIQSTKDTSKMLGVVTIVQPGIPGKKQVVYEVELKDGQESGRQVLQEVVTVPPQTQIQTVGTQPPDYATAGVEWMREAGIAESDFYFVDFIIGHEAGWDGTQQWNGAGSGAYGLCQALPASKMASAGADYMTNPVTQIKWCNSYAVGRYGSWYGAYEFWRTHYWW
jgi:resuscitation-promoting factor RpfB